MRLIRFLIGLGLVSAAASIGAGFRHVPLPVPGPELAAPTTLVAEAGDGCVTLYWQASNFGEERAGFAVFQALGDAGSAAGPAGAPGFGATPVATVTGGPASGAFRATVAGLTNGATYSFRVVGLRSGGAEFSAPSNVVTGTPVARQPARLAGGRAGAPPGAGRGAEPPRGRHTRAGRK